MSLKHLLCSAAVIGLLGTAYAQTNDAQAQSRIMYSPASKWSVSRIADRSGRGNDYCAAAQRFSQDVIITLARNQNSESSLALDFQKPMLAKGSVMSVTLDPGAGIQRFFEITPASSKAFVVRLGHDDEFFTAVEKTGFLRVEVEGQSYNFNLADVRDGHFKLDSCVANMVMPAAGDESDASPQGSYRHEINALRQQMNELKSENERLADLIENKPVSAVPVDAVEGVAIRESAEDIASLTSQIEVLEKQNASLRNQIEVAGKDSESLRGELEAISAENTRISAQLEALQSDKLTTIRPESHQAGLDHLRAENERLKQALEQAKSGSVPSRLTGPVEGSGGNAEIAELKEKIAQLEKNKADLEKELAATAQLQARIRELESQLAGSTQTESAQGISVERQVLEKQIGTLEAQITEKDAALNNLKTQIRNLATLEAKNNALEEALAKQAQGGGQAFSVSLREQLRMLADENSRLKLTLADIKAEQSAQMAEAQEVARYVVQLKADNEHLNAALKDMQAQAAANSKGNSDELAALAAENETLKAQIAGLEEAASNKVANLRTEIQSLKQENDGLKVAMLESQSALRKARAERYAYENAAQNMARITPAAGSAEEAILQDAVYVEPTEADANAQDGPSEEATADPVIISEEQPKASEPAPAEIKVEEAKAPSEPKAEPVIQQEPAQLTEAQRQEKALAEKLETMEEPQVEPVKASVSEDPYEEIAVAPPKKPSVTTARVDEQTYEAPAQISTPEEVQSPSITASAQMIEQLLEGAAIINSSRDIALVEKASNALQSVYQWRSNKVYGSAELKNIASQDDFDEQVKAYLEKTQSRCDGDFAIVPDRSMLQGETRIDTYEVACVGGSVSSAASLLFFNRDGTFTAMAHEAPADDMDLTMDMRDRVLSSMQGS